MQTLVIDPRLTNPFLCFLFQEHPEKVPKCLTADDFFDKFVVVFIAFQKAIVGGDALADAVGLHVRYFVRFQEGQKSLTEIFGDIFCISDKLFRFLISEEFILLLLFENVDLLIFILVVTVVGGGSVLGLSARQLSLSRGHVQRIIVLNRVFLVLVDDFCDLLDGVSCHLAEVVLDLQFGGVFFGCEGEVEVVFVVPVEPLEAKLLLSQDLLGEDACFAHHTQFIRRVHSINYNYAVLS